MFHIHNPPAYCRDGRRRILIYYDNGVSINSLEQSLKAFEPIIEPSLYKVEVVNAEYLRKFIHWESQTDLIVIPGGRSLPYYQALGNRGNRRIVDYFENGGHYLGICAGGFYGTALTVFEKGGDLEKIVKGSLNFYTGVAEGPAYGLGEFKYQTEQGAHAARIAVNVGGFSKEMRVYFNGGCYFHGGENENITVLARYMELKDHPSAIVGCQVGLGCAILSGVHFEYQQSASSFQKTEGKGMSEKLEPTENERKVLCAQIMKRFGLENQE